MKILVAAVASVTVSISVTTMGSSPSTVACPDDRLSGTWELRMGARFDGTADSTIGVVSLSCLSPPLTGFWVSMALATHAGVYSADLERMGIPTEFMRPITAARGVMADSVEIGLHPGPDHGAVLLLGHFDGGGVIRGHWYLTGYADERRGSFQLLRLSTSSDWARLNGYYFRRDQAQVSGRSGEKQTRSHRTRSPDC
jgi:hypothetical protein